MHTATPHQLPIPRPLGASGSEMGRLGALAALSLALHGALLWLPEPEGPSSYQRQSNPAVVELYEPPPAPEEAPEPEAPEPEPAPVKPPEPPAEPEPKPVRRQPAKAAPEPAQKTVQSPTPAEPAPTEPVVFDNVVLSNAPGDSANFAVATPSVAGTARGTSGRSGSPSKQAGSPTGTGGAPWVPLGELSSRPSPPSLGALLERNFPERARTQGVEGRAVVRARIGPEGIAKVLSVVSESVADYGFGAACKRTVNGSRWAAPKDAKGRPVATTVRYACNFKIRF